MNENFPSPIKNDGDLEYYENYISKSGNGENEKALVKMRDSGNMSYIPADNIELPKELKNTAYMPAFLSKHIGKLVRAELLLGNNLYTRTGILMSVGKGFIVLRSKNNCTLMCDSNSIKFVTIVHNNDLNSLMTNY